MKIEELRSRITPLTKKEQYYKSHPNHSDDYIEKHINKDDEKIWIPTNHRLVKIKFHKHLLNGVHEAEPDTWIFHLFYN